MLKALFGIIRVAQTFVNVPNIAHDNHGGCKCHIDSSLYLDGIRQLVKLKCFPKICSVHVILYRISVVANGHVKHGYQGKCFVNVARGKLVGKFNWIQKNRKARGSGNDEIAFAKKGLEWTIIIVWYHVFGFDIVVPNDLFGRR